MKRQYCREVGKRANCQAGVFLGYDSYQTSPLVASLKQVENHFD
ncbi:MAG: hypothetical protein AB1861_28495 [Cyanobacteriota bacterium]